MEGLLRKYKISKISNNVKLTERELMICKYLDKIFANLTKRKLDSSNSPYYVNSDNYWIFDIYNNVLYINTKLIQPFFLSEEISPENILDWIDQFYDINPNITLSWSVLLAELDSLGVKEFSEDYYLNILAQLNNS